MSPHDTTELDRRKLLKKLAGAGAVGWVAPVILSSSPAAAGVFTAKCAPGTISATNSFMRTACLNNRTIIAITINFSGPCPCGGTQIWCSQKNSPAPLVGPSGSTLTFSVDVFIASDTTITGSVALGCTDRDGDTQFAVYNWSMSASDNGGPCNTEVNEITAVAFSGRTLIDTGMSTTCPTLPSFAPFAAPAGPQPGVTRPPDG